MVEPRYLRFDVCQMRDFGFGGEKRNVAVLGLLSNERFFITEVKKKYSVMKESEALEFHHPKAFA